MNRKEFTDELRSRLSGMPEHELEDRISFYNEKIDEHIANGDSEETAVATLGSVDTVVAEISSELSLTKLVKDRVKPKKKVSVGLIVLLILGFPVWFPLTLTAFILIFTIYIVIWTFILAFFIVDLALVVAAVATIPCAVLYLMASNPAGAVFSIGAGMTCAGLALLLFRGCVSLSGALLSQTGKVLLAIKKSLIGKEDSDNGIA